MKTYVRIAAVFCAAAVFCLDGCGNSVERERERMVDRFVACTSDSLGDTHRAEIRGLFDQFWARADQQQVYDEDVVEIEKDIHRYIDAGRITTDSLLYFMAKVGYYTYRKDPRYNVPERIVDHPTLNPDAALIQFDQGGIRMFYRVPRDSTADSTAADSAAADTAAGHKKTPGR